MHSMALATFIIVFCVFSRSVVCQTPIPNSPAEVQPDECEIPACDCCVTKDCNTCNGNCIDGLFGGKCRNKCPDRCVSCDDYGATNENYPGHGYCTECKPEYYSDPPDYFQCNYKCSQVGCVTCLSATQCHSCIKGYYLVPTTSEFGTCTLCPSTCTTCTSSTSCSECVSSKFEGNACEKCSPGYYGGECNTPCPDHCRDKICARSTGDCLNCMDGFTGARCNKCFTGRYGQNCDLECSENCNDLECFRYNGQCTKGCVDMFYGDMCEKCLDGKYGETCSSDCPVNCFSGKCNRDTGFCDKCMANFQGDTCEFCKEGLYGADCSLSCDNNCKVCNRGSGECEACNGGFYGQQCTKTCSLHCNGTCDQNGLCALGCQDGYSGDKCCVQGENCIECSSINSCSKCIAGKYGEICELDCSACCDGGTCNKDDGSCTKPTDQESEELPAGAIAGGVVGVAFVIGATVVIVVYLTKKRQNQKEQKSTEAENVAYFNLSGRTDIQRLNDENKRLKAELDEIREKYKEYENPQSQYMGLDF